MQVLQLRVGDILCQFKSLTSIGAIFLNETMARDKATIQSIKSMIDEKHVALYLSE